MSRAVNRGRWQQNKNNKKTPCSQVSEMPRVQTVEEECLVIKHLEKKHSSKECDRGAAVALDEGSAETKHKTPQDPESVKPKLKIQQAPLGPDLRE